MTVAILYICTGKYSIFWKDFYQSCELFFLPEDEKKYFVFSDTLDQKECGHNVEIIYQEKMGWPFDTLKRFHLFTSIKQKLLNYDYLFFFNANILFRQAIDESILFVNNTAAELIVVRHPFFAWVMHPRDFPYERRKTSTAYLKKNEGEVYAFGAFNGGRAKSYLEMAETLKSNIDEDLKNDIIAIWHDESHLNKYIWTSKKPILYLEHNYAFPQGQELDLKANVFISVLDKNNYGGHDFLRDKENSIPVPRRRPATLVQRIKNRLRRMYKR